MMTAEYCPTFCEWVGAWLHDNSMEIPHHDRCPHCNNVAARLVPFSETGPFEDPDAAEVSEEVMDDGCHEVIVNEDFFADAPSDLLDILELHVSRWGLICSHCGRGIFGNSPSDAIQRWNELRKLIDDLGE